MTRDFYELLGVPRSASEDELKKAYRRLARELHPDTRPGDAEAEARFKQVTVAYETLRDPERRRRYDMFGPDAVRGTGAGGGDPFGFSGGLGDLFDVFFNQGFSANGARGARRQGADAEIVLQIGLAEAVFGTRREVNLKAHVTCATCEGSGAREGTSPTTCPDGIESVQSDSADRRPYCLLRPSVSRTEVTLRPRRGRIESSLGRAPRCSRRRAQHGALYRASAAAPGEVVRARRARNHSGSL